MPEKGTSSFLGDTLSPASEGSGIPRCELYLYVADPSASLRKLTDAGRRALGESEARSWGDVVAYGVDPDGHIVAFAQL